MCELLIRDLSDIYIRLFNHRAALQGLTSNFIKEFEEKRGEPEVLALARTFELIVESRDRTLPSVAQQLDCHLQQLNESVGKAKQKCENILTHSEDKKSDWLESRRREREMKWSEFMASQVVRSSRVDEEFNSKLESLNRHYSELEEKLREGTTHVL